jgi:hypothetical protein
MAEVKVERRHREAARKFELELMVPAIEEGGVRRWYLRTDATNYIAQALAAAEHLGESRQGEAGWDELLNASRNLINAFTMVTRNADGSRVAREEAEGAAFRLLAAAVDKFPHPCASAALPPPPGDDKTGGG